MGCGESRVKRISLTSEQDWEGGTAQNWENSSDVGSKQLKVVQELSVSSLEQPTIEEEEKVDNIKKLSLRKSKKITFVIVPVCIFNP